VAAGEGAGLLMTTLPAVLCTSCSPNG